MNILITGASGFIGKHLTEYFSEKYHLFTPSHKQLDLLDEKAVRRYFQNHPIDLVIHCAVVGGNTQKLWVKGMFHDNLHMFFNIVRCNNYYRRFINIGSGAEYDKRYPIIHVRENDFGVHIPIDDYGLYKYICANYINSADNIVDLRVFGIFGEWEEYRQRFISNALCRHMYGLPITIKQNVYFDYLDVLDFVKIVDYFILHKSKFKSYNVGTGKKIDLVTIAHEIIKLYGDNGYPIVTRQKGFAKEYSCNTNRLYRELSEFKTTQFVHSLERLSMWYQHHKSRINKKQL
jgi:nucleoside-diphosphate-sugar epimerase